MKNGLDMVNEAYKLLLAGDATEGITGDVYKLIRPENSQLEDYVIKSLALTGNQLQKGMIMVNCHAPNLQNLEINNRAVSNMPNTIKLSQMASKAEGILKDVATDGYRMWIDQPALPYTDTDGTLYMNLRVYYQFFQSNYTNI